MKTELRGICLNTTQLECFLEVSNSLNFSRAAERLRITQPAVSHQIQTLEDELGVKLFHRTSKRVRLTQEGHAFLPYAADILRLSGLSKARMRAYRQFLPVRFGIGCRNVAELRLLKPALEQLRKEKPEVHPDLRFIPFDSLENLLEEGEVQMMFSFQEAAPKKAKYWELVKCPVMCMCSPSHPLAKEERLTLRQLKEVGAIAVCRPPICPPSLFALQGEILASCGPENAFFCDSQAVTDTLVSAGYTFALVAQVPGTGLSGMRYIPVPEIPALSFGAVHLPGERSPILRSLLQSLQAQFSREDGQEP